MLSVRFSPGTLTGAGGVAEHHAPAINRIEYQTLRTIIRVIALNNDITEIHNRQCTGFHVITGDQCQRTSGRQLFLRWS